MESPVKANTNSYNNSHGVVEEETRHCLSSADLGNPRDHGSTTATATTRAADPPTERTLIELERAAITPISNINRHRTPAADPPPTNSSDSNTRINTVAATECTSCTASSKMLLEKLCEKIDHLQDRVQELEGENKRLSALSFDFLNGSAMNISNLQDISDDHGDGTTNDNEYIDKGNIVSRCKSLPAHVLASRQRSALAASSEHVHVLPQDVQQEQRQSESERRWKELKECYINSQHFSRTRDLVFLHPEEVGKRYYTVEELHKIHYRPFPSRLFITNKQLEWNTVWLRTRHTDHHVHKSSFIQVRDAFKADAITNNPPGAKYALTELLNMCYGMKESDYYSFACTIASAFSNQAANTEFEKSLLLHPARMELIDARLTELGAAKQYAASGSQLELDLLRTEQERSRKRLTQLMDIVFSKLKQKKLLVDDNKDNIYRLVHCMTKYNRRSWLPYFYAFFSFFFQTCAASYVALSLTDLDVDPEDEINVKAWDKRLVYQNIFLAVGTACYGAMVAFPEIMSTRELYRCLYRSENSMLSTMDFIVNCVLPVSGAICGFLVVLQAGTFLEGVLNAVALLFITEIDDQLPYLLELDKKDIVQGFLIDQAMEDYKIQNLDREIVPIEFSDLHITNSAESGSVPTSGVTFQPYEVFGDASAQQHGSTISIDASNALTGRPNLHTRRRLFKKQSGRDVRRLRQGDMGQQVANKRSVTAHCLLRKIEWQYTGDPEGEFDGSSSPRIGHLILHKLVGGAPINIVGKQKAPKEVKKPWFSITGVYVITSFSMSDDILRLRVCGSETATHFTRAFQYYNLWPLEQSAKALLKTKLVTTTQKERDENRRVLYGLERPIVGPTCEATREETDLDLPVPVEQEFVDKEIVIPSYVEFSEPEFALT